MSRIVITTWGSLGDLHPYLAIALGLQRRGHEVVVATNLRHQQTIQSTSAWPSESPTCARRAHQRGLTLCAFPGICTSIRIRS
ncbi:MAG: glycosyltransferase [Pirellulaceae bacterium]